MASYLLPCQMRIQSSLTRPRNSQNSRRTSLVLILLGTGASFSRTLSRCLTAYQRCLQISVILSSMRSSLFFSPFLLNIQTITIIIYMYSSYATHRKTALVNSMFQDPTDFKRKTESFRKSNNCSQRKPIFDQRNYRLPSEKKALHRSFQVQPPDEHIQQVIHDDFCGCEQNLEPCISIQTLLKNVSEKQMRQEYSRLDNMGPRRLKSVLHQKYFRFLPRYYPQLYEAHLANIINCINQQLTLNQFLCLAWIQFHAKLEHITFFIFSDLRNSLSGSQKFRYSLEIALIKAESANQQRIPLLAFIDDYNQSVGAVIIPLSQYARFVKILLRKGIKAMLQLLVILLGKKRNSFFQLLHFSSSGGKMREQSRQLPWQQFLEQLQIGVSKV